MSSDDQKVKKAGAAGGTTGQREPGKEQKGGTGNLPDGGDKVRQGGYQPIVVIPPPPPPGIDGTEITTARGVEYEINYNSSIYVDKKPSKDLSGAVKVYIVNADATLSEVVDAGNQFVFEIRKGSHWGYIDMVGKIKKADTHKHQLLMIFGTDDYRGVQAFHINKR